MIYVGIGADLRTFGWPSGYEDRDFPLGLEVDYGGMNKNE